MGEHRKQIRSRTDYWGLLIELAFVTSITCNSMGGKHLLAWERLALSPVGCGSSFLGPSGLTPNLMEGGGPVFCGDRGVAVGCWGIGGTGGGDV